MLQTWALPSVSCAQLGSTQLLEVPLVRSVVTPTSVPPDQPSASPVPPDKSSPPAGPATKSKTTRQAPARGGKRQTSSWNCITISALSPVPRRTSSNAFTLRPLNPQDNPVDSQVDNLVDNLQINRVASLVENRAASQVGNQLRNHQ